MTDSGFTVLLTDINMPDLNGLELAERALSGRTDEDALSVVVLTAHTDTDYVIDTIRVGAVDFIRKPVRLDALAAAIARAHEKAARHRIKHREAAAKHKVEIQTMKAGLKAERSLENDDNRAAFLSIISHEMLTPLNPIIGFSQLIEKQPDSLEGDTLREYARYIREAGESLFGLTESMLKLIDMRTRPPIISKDQWDARELLAHLRDRKDQEAKTRSQFLKINCPAGYSIYADRKLLLEALGYLLDNAIKFSPEGSSIVLSARPDGREAVFTVEDAGPGMTDQELARALSPFGMIDDGLARSHGGLGLGLPLSLLLAGHMDGRLVIDSTPGWGTRATIYIPHSD